MSIVVQGATTGTFSEVETNTRALRLANPYYGDFYGSYASSAVVRNSTGNTVGLTAGSNLNIGVVQNTNSLFKTMLVKKIFACLQFVSVTAQGTMTFQLFRGGDPTNATNQVPQAVVGGSPLRSTYPNAVGQVIAGFGSDSGGNTNGFDPVYSGIPFQAVTCTAQQTNSQGAALGMGKLVPLYDFDEYMQPLILDSSIGSVGIGFTNATLTTAANIGFTLYISAVWDEYDSIYRVY